MVDVGWNGGSQNYCAVSRLGVGCSALLAESFVFIGASKYRTDLIWKVAVLRARLSA